MSRSARQRMNAKGRRTAYRLLTAQCVIAGVATVLFAITGGALAAQSALLGSLITIIPNGFFIVLVFYYTGASSAQQVVLSFYAGEALKLVLSVLLLTLALIFFHGPLLPLFAVFALLHLMHLLAPILLFKTN